MALVSKFGSVDFEVAQSNGWRLREKMKAGLETQTKETQKTERYWRHSKAQ